MMVVERKGGGLAVINTLLRLGYPSLMAKESFDEFGNLTGKQIGFNPGQENLLSLLSMFRHTINTGALTLRHPRLIQEAKWIVRKVKVTSEDNVKESWVCPSKGVVTPHGVRISDDLFRATAITELVARDVEWADNESEHTETREWAPFQMTQTDYDTESASDFFPENIEKTFPTIIDVDHWSVEDYVEEGAF